MPPSHARAGNHSVTRVASSIAVKCSAAAAAQQQLVLAATCWAHHTLLGRRTCERIHHDQQRSLAQAVHPSLQQPQQQAGSENQDAAASMTMHSTRCF